MPPLQNMPIFELNLDGHPSRVSIKAAELDAVHLPLLENWEGPREIHGASRRAARRRGRFLVLPSVAKARVRSARVAIIRTSQEAVVQQVRARCVYSRAPCRRTQLRDR